MSNLLSTGNFKLKVNKYKFINKALVQTKSGVS